MPELRAVGERKQWSASLSVAAGQVPTPNAAHAKSLGRLLARLGHVYPDTAFRVRITENLDLLRYVSFGREDLRPPGRRVPRYAAASLTPNVLVMECLIPDSER